MKKKYSKFQSNNKGGLAYFILWVFLIISSSTNAQCNTGNPVSSSVYTPNYSGFEEQLEVASSSVNGKYYRVNVLANRFYTFYTYDAGDVENGYQDYITITDASGNFLDFGPSPLQYSSFDYTGEIRYYFHSNSSCQTSNVQKWARMMSSTSLCMPPTNLNETNVTSNSVTLNWDEQLPLPDSGYQYYIVYEPGNFGSPFPPGNGANSGVTGFTMNNSVTLTNLGPNRRYFFWVRSNCGGNYSVWMEGGMFTTPAVICNQPTNLQVNNVTANSALFSWQAPSPTPSNGYVFAYNTTGLTPSFDDFYPSTTSQFVPNLASNTTYYYFVRSNCNSLQSQWAFGGSFTTPIGINCNSATYGLHPTATYFPNCTGSPETIASNARAGEYANVAVQPNKQYTFASSIATDYITITNESGTILYASGLSPLNWQSGSNNETIRFFLHTNSSCGNSQTNRSRTISCAPSASCAPPSNINSYNIGANVASISWTGSTSNPPLYDVYFSTSNSAPNAATTPNGNINATAETLNNLATGTTYYFWVRSNCGSLQSSWVSGGNFTTLNSTSCNPPTALTSGNVGVASADISWTASTSLPSFYNIYFSTSSTPPTAATVPDGDTDQTIATLINLTASTTYYFWVRSDCGTTQSIWVSGGSFTTNSVGNCTEAVYGQFPPATFTPACSGNLETIVTNAYASEYSNVNIVANKQYTFTSSVTSDYVTISNAAGTVVYTSGNSPLTWLSGSTSGVIRYYLHTNSSCGSDNTDRARYITCTNAAPTCNPPTGLNDSVINSSSAQISWSAPTPSPALFDVYFSISSTTPTAATTPVGETDATSATLINLTAATTYYFWVRSDCGSTQSSWVYGGSFTTNALGNCTEAIYGQYPDNQFTPTCSGNTETIATDAYAGEFSFVDVYPNRVYTFTSSVATDYITITSGDGAIVYNSGTTPVVWQSGTITDVAKFFLHTNANCGSQNVNRVKSVTCTTAANVCNPPTNIGITHITASSARVEYTSAVPSPAEGYDFYHSTSSISPENSPGGTTSSSRLLTGLSGNTTYYYWIRSNCDTIQSGWISGGSFTTPPFYNCSGAIHGINSFTTFTPSCSGAAELISTNNWAGHFSEVNFVANKQYTFTSSVATDYLTITNASGTILFASGVSPVVWNSGSNSGVLRYFIHSNASCGSQMVSRSKFIACTTFLANETFDSDAFQLFPNPTLGIVNFSCPSTIDRIVITNILGQHILEKTINDLQGQVDLSNYAAGTYLMKVFVEEKSKVFKVIKQ